MTKKISYLLVNPILTTLIYKNLRPTQTTCLMMKKMMIIIIEEITYLANRKRGSNILKKAKKIRRKITTITIMQENELPLRDKEPLAAMTFSRKSINSHSSINKSMQEEEFMQNLIIIEQPDYRCPIVRKYLKGAALRMGTKSGETSGRHYKTLARTIVKNKMQEA
jgi:hypothetical protein